MNSKMFYAVVVLVAVMAAAAGYCHFCYPEYMLVLQVKTYENGPRNVNVLDWDGKNHTKSFEIGNDLGEPSYYPIDLPRVMPRDIFIDQLASEGRYEVDRITLRNEDTSYSWDNQGVCTSMTMPNGAIKREPCGGDQPLLAMADNSHLKITSIPRSEKSLNKTRGIFAGLFSFMAVLLAAAWMTRPVNTEERSAVFYEYSARLLWILLISVYLAQFSAIWKYSVDLPFWEEWDYFLPEGLPKGLSWDWLFGFAGYHRVVPTKFMAWLNLQLFDLDFILQKRFNYFIYGGLLFTLVKLKNRVIGRSEFVLFPAFLLFLLSPIAFENHVNSYQSQIHLVIIFTLVALLHIYSDRLQGKPLAIFFFCLIAAINTFSGGMTIAAVLLPCWAVFVTVQIARGRIDKQKGWWILLAGGAIVSAAAASWIYGYSLPAGNVWISPFSGLFWDTFFNLLSFGFGFEMENPILGAICLLAVIVPVIILWCDKELRQQERVWQVTAGVLCFLAILATISITRGTFAGTSKASRYVEFGLMLIPLTAMAWWLALKRVAVRRVVLLSVWLTCFGAFIDDWSFSPYRDVGQMELFVLETLEDHVLGRGDGSFPWSHPKPLPPFFEGARRLDVKFTRQFRGLATNSQKYPLKP